MLLCCWSVSAILNAVVRQQSQQQRYSAKGEFIDGPEQSSLERAHNIFFTIFLFSYRISHPIRADNLFHAIATQTFSHLFSLNAQTIRNYSADKYYKIDENFSLDK